MNCFLLLAAIYGTLANGDFVKAPDTVKIGDSVCVTSFIGEQNANSIGYKLMEDNPPNTDAQHYACAVGWGETNRIYRVYEVRTLPVPQPTPRRIYKYDLSVACLEANLLDTLMESINSDSRVKWFWDSAVVLEEDNAYFISETNKIITTLGVQESTVRSVIERAVELSQDTEERQ